MSRLGRPFKEVFDSLAGSLDLAPSDVTAKPVLGVKLLDAFTRGYRDAYNRRPWEDAWKPGELTPTNRMVSYLQVEDARRFEFWSADPRQGAACVQIVGMSTASDGITLGTDAATVFGFWLPKAPRFTLDAYNNGTAYAAGAVVLVDDGHVYLCLQAATGQNPKTQTAYWRQVPVLDVLAESTIDLAAGRYLISVGRFDEGNSRKGQGEATLEREAQDEFIRVAKAKRDAVQRWPMILN